MKTTLRGLVVVGSLAGASVAGAQSLDLTNSSWGGSNLFYSSGTSGIVVTTSGMPVTGTTAYGATITSSNSTVWGLANKQPSATADYNLGGGSTSLAAGTALKLVFTGLSGVPNYVAYTGGALTGYTYNSATGTLTFESTTVNPVASGSDPTGATLTSAFGMIIVTSGSNNFGGAVFRSDMYWGDINPLNTSYTGVSPTTGLNVNGQNGVLGTFEVYAPMSYLNSMGVTVPANTAASALKSDGTHLDLSMTRVFKSATGLDPNFAGGGYTFSTGSSQFDFNGGGVDGFAILSYSNSNWSQVNIGFSAVPEPTDFALIAGVAAVGALIRRRRRTAG